MPDALEPSDPTAAASRSALKEVGLLFLKLGTIAFGGPAAHIALMREEVVRRRHWLNDQHFLDLLGATNLIPGPSSTEMAIHIGYTRAGWRGLIVAGVCFIFPALLIVLALAWAYVHFGSRPEAIALLAGIKPVMIAIILQALWRLAQTAVKGPLTAIVGLATLLLALGGVHELALLLSGGLVVMAVANRARLAGVQCAVGPTAGWLAGGPCLAALSGAGQQPVGLLKLFLVFLKVGSILYGSGYVLLAFLRADLVTRFGWLSDQQLVDAIAVGQVTPGPVFTTATFIGYTLAGLPGALLATLGIFLPSFIFVALSNPLIPRIRHSAWASSLLDGINVASLGLMAAVTVQLAQASLVDVPAGLIGVVAAIALFYYGLNTTWLIAGAGLIGLLRAALAL